MSKRRRWLRAIGPAVLLAFGGAYALASWNWCGDRSAHPPEPLGAWTAEGSLVAGAAREPLTVPFPVPVAGYGRPRSEVRSTAHPLFARAVFLKVDAVSVAIVQVELLTLPTPLEEEIRGALADLKLSELWVVAAHAHSSLGGYDSDLVPQVAGTGRYHAEARREVVRACVQAVRAASTRAVPATLAVGEGKVPALVSSRDQAEGVDARLTRIVLRAAVAEGAEGAAIAELTLFAAHPTLVSPTTEALSPDYPGYFAERREAANAGVALVLQGAVGNARPVLDEPTPPKPEEAFAAKLEQAVTALAVTPVQPVTLAVSRVRTYLPRPDAHRLVPAYARAAGDNALCSSAPRSEELGALVLGPLRLLAVPGEVTFDAAQVLEHATGATRTLSLVNGYVGYFEMPALVRANEGESKRQYFGPELLDVLTEGATAASRALRPAWPGR